MWRCTAVVVASSFLALSAQVKESTCGLGRPHTRQVGGSAELSSGTFLLSRRSMSLYPPPTPRSRQVDDRSAPAERQHGPVQPAAADGGHGAAAAGAPAAHRRLPRAEGRRGCCLGRGHATDDKPVIVEEEKLSDCLLSRVHICFSLWCRVAAAPSLHLMCCRKDLVRVPLSVGVGLLLLPLGRSLGHDFEGPRVRGVQVDCRSSLPAPFRWPHLHTHTIRPVTTCRKTLYRGQPVVDQHGLVGCNHEVNTQYNPNPSKRTRKPREV